MDETDTGTPSSWYQDGFKSLLGIAGTAVNNLTQQQQAQQAAAAAPAASQLTAWLTAKNVAIGVTAIVVLLIAWKKFAK